MKTNNYAQKIVQTMVPIIPIPICRVRISWKMFDLSGYKSLTDLINDIIQETYEKGYEHYSTITYKVRYAAEIIFLHYSIYPLSAMETLQKACYPESG